MKSFIATLWDECSNTIEPKFEHKYAVIAFGSMARGEMTPYSDLEFGILVETENEEQKYHLKNLTNYLHLKVLNLGETIIPSMAIPSLNNFYSTNPLDNWFYDDITPRGFSFDGLMPGACKTPLGERDESGAIIFELIDVADKMAKYQYVQHSEILVTRHLSNTIANAILIYGDETLLQKYKQKVKGILSEIYSDGISVGKKQGLTDLESTLKRYDLRLGEQSKEGTLYNIKQEIYRLPNLIIEGLATYFNLEANSGYDKIIEMCKNEYICEQAAENLKIALSIAMQLRLQNYLTNNKQDDTMTTANSLELEESDIKKYFLIPDLEILFEFYHRVLPLHKDMLEFCGKNTDGDRKSFLKERIFFDDCSKNKALIYRRLFISKLAKDCFDNATKENPEDFESFNYLSIICAEHGEYGISEQHLLKAQTLCEANTNNAFLTKIYHNYGNLYIRLSRFIEAEGYLNKAINSLKFTANIIEKQYQKSKILHGIGLLKFELSQFKESKNAFLEIQTILENECGYYPAMDIMLLLNNLGRTHWKLGEYTEAIATLRKASEIANKLYGNQPNPNVILPLHNLACIYNEIGEYDISEKFFKHAIHILSNISEKNHPSFAAVFNDYGVLLDVIGKPKEAKEYYERSLYIKKTIYDDDFHPEIIRTLNNLAFQGADIGNFKNNEYFEKIKLIMKEGVSDLSEILQLHLYNNFGSINLQLQNVSSARECYEKALDIAKRLYGNKEHYHIASILDSLGTLNCLNETGRQQALLHYKAALTIRKNIYGNKPHSEIINSLNNLGVYHQYCSKNNKTAMHFFNQSLEMSKQIYFKFNAHHPSIKKAENNLLNHPYHKTEMRPR